jgi:hypothetical protein
MQTVGTQPGQDYELSFWIGGSSQILLLPKPSPPAGYTGIEVNVNGAVPAQPSHAVPADPFEWDPVHVRFPAMSGTTTIAFRGIGTAGPNGHGGDYVGLDNVMLQEVCFLPDALIKPLRGGEGVPRVTWVAGHRASAGTKPGSGSKRPS